jgi:hypothetical protein
MKKFLLTLLAGGLLIGPAGSVWPQDQAAGAENLPSLFKLETLDDDSPETARKKAALRLFKSYCVTVRLLQNCELKEPQEAPKTQAGFDRRNGSTLDMTQRVIKQLGGFNREISGVVATTMDAEVAVGVSDCKAFLKTVQDGAKDIYKAPEYADDYALVRQ